MHTFHASSQLSEGASSTEVNLNLSLSLDSKNLSLNQFHGSSTGEAVLNNWFVLAHTASFHLLQLQLSIVRLPIRYDLKFDSLQLIGKSALVVNIKLGPGRVQFEDVLGCGGFILGGLQRSRYFSIGSGSRSVQEESDAEITIIYNTKNIAFYCVNVWKYRESWLNITYLGCPSRS